MVNIVDIIIECYETGTSKEASLKPLLLNDNYPWCRDLKAIIAKENILSQYFSINGDEFDFADSIPEEYRTQVRERAFEYYNPQKRS